MKIIILHPHFAYYRGASKFVLEVGERLAKKGLDILVVTIMADRRVIKPYPHIKFHFLGGPKTDRLFFWISYPIFQWKLHRFLDTIPDKVLFPQVMPANWWAFIYKKFHPEVPLIWMCQEPSAFIHSTLVIESLSWPFRTVIKLLKPFMIPFDIWLAGGADYVIANSKYGKGLIQKTYNRTASYLAYPSVDINKFKPEGKKGKYIFTVSRLDKQKRIDILIRAYAIIPDDLRKKYHLLIGGEGREKQILIDLVKNLKIESFVEFLGSLSEDKLPALYAQASLVVFPAVGEPFGIVPLEAMACGTPVIATEGGGTEESIVDGETGFLIKSNQVGLLAGKMTYLLTRENLLGKMGKDARLHMEKNFSWDKTAQEIEKALTKVEMSAV